MPSKSKIASQDRRFQSRSGLTLVEILIALTMTLIVLFAMAQAFQYASGEIAGGRAVLEMSNRLRNAQQLMRTDLAGVTVDVRPHTETPANGYFEYIEGPVNDKTNLNPADGTGNGYLGDLDDIIAFTSRNLEGSFRGRYPDRNNLNLNEPIQSSFAEIIWFTEVIDSNQNGIAEFTDSATLYRRVLLIRPNLNQIVVQASGSTPAKIGLYDVPLVNGGEDLQRATNYFASSDISARWIDSDGDGFRDLIVANSLSDLSRRENRFARDSRPFAFPHSLPAPPTNPLPQLRMAELDANGNRVPTGDDILMSDLSAFDIRIFSPNSPVDLIDLDQNGVAETVVQPSDIGFVGTYLPPANPPVYPETRANGGFVDLAIIGSPFDRSESSFVSLPTLRSQSQIGLSNSNPFQVYFCTWSPHYETDGIDQDGLFGIDQGTNGLDDDGANGVDDDGEKETAPPYPYPVRGIQVTFRIIEKNSRQVRQTSVIHSFLPQ